MNDLQLIADFLFSILSSLWNVIRGNIVLSISIMVVIMSWIVSLLQTVKGKDK